MMAAPSGGAASSAAVIALTVPRVPTGMKAGVGIGPRGVWRTPARAFKVGHLHWRRAATTANLAEIAPVPLFVKYPGQRDGATDERFVKTIDVLPTIADVPEIVSELVDEPDEHLTNLGSKGLGEPPIVPVAAAIANAIRDATGADVRQLPITREEMLRALEEAQRKERRGAPAPV